jgi:hypothetical protein
MLSFLFPITLLSTAEGEGRTGALATFLPFFLLVFTGLISEPSLRAGLYQ